MDKNNNEAKELRTPTEQFPGLLTSFEQDNNEFTFQCDKKVKLRISILTDRIIRVRYAPKGYFPDDFSYAIDPKFKAEDVAVEIKEKEDHFRFTTDRMICLVIKDGMKVKLLDKSGTVVCEDEKGFHWEKDQDKGGEIVQMSKKLHGREFFYGLGDKSNKLNLRKNRYENWGTDTYGYGKDSDPLYKNIPFYFGLHAGIGYGIFFDNTYRTYFDFGKERANVTSFWAANGEMNYYLIYGPDLMEVAEQYTDLTGRPELPPLWALGYHQCKWSYYPEKQVREITSKFRDLKLPCDAIYLDIDYMDGFRCFTWDKEKFPDPKKMVADFEKEGFKTVVMIDPGIKVDFDYWVCKDGFEKDMFCKRADGQLLEAPVWPGDCYFPDYTRADVREWWGELYRELIEDIKVKGVWNDMNEPAVFLADNFTQSDKTFYEDVRHDYDGHPCSHRKAHNIYGMQMTRATYDGIKKIAPDLRPFVLTRSAYSGSQRFTSGWTGDNIASWEHLWIANMQCQRLSISGMSFMGSDIGGFIEQPTPELYVRWLQMAVFHPFFRTHSSGDHGDQEPWSFGEDALNLARRAIELRYQLLQYIYTAFWQYSSKGTPMLRPLSFLDQYDLETLHRVEEFALGDSLLICPISQPEVDGRWMYLPKGSWYNFWTDQATMSGAEFWAETTEDKIPIYVRAGSVVPTMPVQQYVGEIKRPKIDLHIYNINGEENSQLYADSGDGYDYEKGDYRLSNFVVKGDGKSLTVNQTVEGNYSLPQDKFMIKLHAFSNIKSIHADGEEIRFEQLKEFERDLIYFYLDCDFKEIKLKLG